MPFLEETAKKYYSAEELIADVFRVEAKELRPTSHLEEFIRGTNPADLTAQDLIVEAMNLRALALRAADDNGFWILIAKYTIPTDASLDARLAMAIERLAADVLYESPKAKNKWLLQDAVRDWAGHRMIHSYDWWAKHMQRPKQTVQRWCTSKLRADKSAKYLLDRRLEVALARIEAALHERRLNIGADDG